jgi:hypothetical protein
MNSLKHKQPIKQAQKNCLLKTLQSMHITLHKFAYQPLDIVVAEVFPSTKATSFGLVTVE